MQPMLTFDSLHQQILEVSNKFHLVKKKMELNDP